MTESAHTILEAVRVMPAPGEVEGLEKGLPDSLQTTDGKRPATLPSMVTVPWLAAALRVPVAAPHPPQLPPQDTIHVFDCSWYLPIANRDPRAEYEAAHIPTAHFFDIDQYCDTSSPYPHMLPSATEWSTLMTTHHISNTDTIVLYDASTAFCASTRVWFMLLYFGHSPHLIRVLDGGFNEWRETYPTHCDKGEDHDRHAGQTHRACGPYIAHPQLSMLWTKQRILDALAAAKATPDRSAQSTVHRCTRPGALHWYGGRTTPSEVQGSHTDISQLAARECADGVGYGASGVQGGGGDTDGTRGKRGCRWARMLGREWIRGVLW